MNEYETLMVVSECLNLALISLTIYMTVVSGFLAAVYTIGRKLSRGQIGFLVFVFLSFCFFAVWGSVGYFMAAEVFLANVKSLPDNIALVQTLRPSIMVGIMQIAGVVGAMLFLKNIRRSQIQDRKPISGSR